MHKRLQCKSGIEHTPPIPWPLKLVQCILGIVSTLKKIKPLDALIIHQRIAKDEK
jgi:hypothetical protein